MKNAKLTLTDGSEVVFEPTITVQDNFLDENYFKHLQSLVFSKEFPWSMGSVLDDAPIGDIANEIQFVHLAYHDRARIMSDFYPHLQSMLQTMGLFSCSKVKLNVLQRQEKIIEHGFHVDFPEAPLGNLTSILYMNTNNGYTKFPTGEKVESVENRLVTFPVHFPHTGSTNTCDAKVRCVMNINWSKAFGSNNYTNFEWNQPKD